MKGQSLGLGGSMFKVSGLGFRGRSDHLELGWVVGDGAIDVQQIRV